jgi:hypothetical protein
MIADRTTRARQGLTKKVVHWLVASRRRSGQWVGDKLTRCWMPLADPGRGGHGRAHALALVIAGGAAPNLLTVRSKVVIVVARSTVTRQLCATDRDRRRRRSKSRSRSRDRDRKGKPEGEVCYLPLIDHLSGLRIRFASRERTRRSFASSFCCNNSPERRRTRCCLLHSRKTVCGLWIFVRVFLMLGRREAREARCSDGSD